MKLKTVPEDFIVDEINQLNLEGGPYLYAILKKKDYTTLKALEVLSRHFRIPIQFIGYAGLKDKTAITTQYLSFFRVRKEILESLWKNLLKNIVLRKSVVS